ncbi:MAG: acetate kinase [Deltaproteobacteria bacterium]|nr:acetate kinase [Deltaproteobacteria bacterium]
MKVLVLNSGSSSIKYQLFAMPEATVLARGSVERIGEPRGEVKQRAGERETRLEEPIPDHESGLRRAMQLLTSGEGAPLSAPDEIEAVGHRVVHGGERFTETVLIDDEVLAAIEEHVALAPLHNPPNLIGIRVAREVLPRARQVAVFDTAFHQGMPPRAYLYGLPHALYEEDGIRRYGFHGTSHRYVATRAAELLGRPLEELKLITCHLGNGSSMAAIEGGRSVDTSMGLTPLEGLVMGTRCGDLDPAIVFHLARTKDLPIDALDRLLNKESGLRGLSGASNDVRELERLRAGGDPGARRALEVFTYRIRKYLGAYLAVLGGADAVVFTAGIGENSPSVRSEVLTGLAALGLELDEARNREAVGREADIAREGAPVRILVVPTDEEKLIARDSFALASAA